MAAWENREPLAEHREIGGRHPRLEVTDSESCTQVFPGYHKRGTLSQEDGQYHELPPEIIDEAHCVNLEMAPGDVAIFGGFPPHCSARWRRQLFLSYNKHSDGGPQRDKHYQEFLRWIRARYAEPERNKLYFR